MVAATPSPEKHPVGKARSSNRCGTTHRELGNRLVRAFVVIPARAVPCGAVFGLVANEARRQHFKGFWIPALHGPSPRPTDQVKSVGPAIRQAGPVGGGRHDGF